jgi:hypothetical protein
MRRFKEFLAEQAFYAANNTYTGVEAPFMQHLLSAGQSRDAALSAIDSYKDDSEEWQNFHMHIVQVVKDLPPASFPLKHADLCEGLYRSKLVRGSHLIDKKRSTREGYKALRSGGRVREVRMKMVERMRRSRAAQKGARKRAPQMQQLQQKRMQSIDRRNKSGLA